MTRRSERIARPSQMAPGMQVQSTIASAPACGRVCTQLSCPILHVRTWPPPPNQLRGDRSPPLLRR